MKTFTVVHEESPKAIGGKAVYPDRQNRLDACVWCGKSEEMDYLTFAGLRPEDSHFVPGWPRSENTVVAFVEHGGCGPELPTYNLRIVDILARPAEMITHLEKKPWQGELTCSSIESIINAVVANFKSQP